MLQRIKVFSTCIDNSLDEKAVFDLMSVCLSARCVLCLQFPCMLQRTRVSSSCIDYSLDEKAAASLMSVCPAQLCLCPNFDKAVHSYIYHILYHMSQIVSNLYILLYIYLSAANQSLSLGTNTFSFQYMTDYKIFLKLISQWRVTQTQTMSTRV